LKDRVSRNTQQETLRWLDDSLEQARARNLTRLVELLNLVRIEILFDMDFSEDPPSTRNRTTGSAFGANHSI